MTEKDFHLFLAFFGNKTYLCLRKELKKQLCHKLVSFTEYIFSDHQPPHFHAWYGDYKAIVNIKDSGGDKGQVPPSHAPKIKSFPNMEKDFSEKSYFHKPLWNC